MNKINCDLQENNSKHSEDYRKFRKVNLSIFLLNILGDWLIIISAMMTAVYLQQWWSYFIAAVIIGNRQHAVSLMLHDSAHYCASENKKINDFFGNFLAAYPMGFSLDSYRLFHFSHHRNPNVEGDGEIWHKKSFAPEWDLPMTRKKIYWLAIKDLFGLGTRNLIYLAKLTAPKKAKDSLAPVAFMTTIIGVLLLTGNWPYLALWYGGLLTGFCASFRMRVWCEHLGIKGTHRIHLGPIQRALFAPHNAWLHYEHHIIPYVPQHQLQALRKVIKNEKILSFEELFDSYENSEPVPSGEVRQEVLYSEK